MVKEHSTPEGQVPLIAAEDEGLIRRLAAGFFLRRGWSVTRARLATMALFAAGLPISALGVLAKDLWTAVAFISIATACHPA